MGRTLQRARTVLSTRLAAHPFFLFRDGPFWLLGSERRDDLIDDSTCVVAMLLQCLQLQLSQARRAKDVEAFLRWDTCSATTRKRQRAGTTAKMHTPHLVLIKDVEEEDNEAQGESCDCELAQTA